MSARPEGTCRLCAKDGPLTFEHIPPRSAGNSDPLKGYSLGAAYRQAAGNRERYVSEQKGAGLHALCRVCNTLCSTRSYVAEMAKWVSIFDDAIDGSLAELRARGRDDSATFTLALRNVYPSRLARQMVVQLLAINEPLFGDDHQHLRDFVLDESFRSLAPGIRLFLAIDTRPRNLYVPATAGLLADGADGLVHGGRALPHPIRAGHGSERTAEWRRDDVRSRRSTGLDDGSDTAARRRRSATR